MQCNSGFDAADSLTEPCCPPWADHPAPTQGLTGWEWFTSLFGLNERQVSEREGPGYWDGPCG